MTARLGFAAAFVIVVVVGTLRDPAAATPDSPQGVLTADLHVHPFPGDGVLTVRQLQREATRRGIDVIAIAGHNNRVALAISGWIGALSGGPVILESQELTTPNFHMIAVGVRTMIDWRLSVLDAVRAIHAQGGVAIAAHPVRLAWKPEDEASLAALDGVEIAHPMAHRTGSSRRELDDFFKRVQTVNADVAAIGSTDFHTAAPLGLCRTYLLTDERTAEGAIRAIGAGRTVAQDRFGRLFGSPTHIREVEQWLARSTPETPTPLLDRLVALSALVVLALSIAWRPRTA